MSKLRRQPGHGRPRTAGPVPQHEVELVWLEDELETFSRLRVTATARTLESPLRVSFSSGTPSDPPMLWFDDQADFSPQDYERVANLARQRFELAQHVAAAPGIYTPEQVFGMMRGGGKTNLAHQVIDQLFQDLTERAQGRVAVMPRGTPLQVLWPKQHRLLVAPATAPTPRTEPPVRNRSRIERRAAQRRRRARGWR